ncbi:MAG: hypothetical protein AAGI37_00840 [Planctomycetota bacterium]
MQWHFLKKRTGYDFSDPISGEFFADGSTDNPATALVAESLQNALDAGRDIDRGGEPVRVRMTLLRGDDAMSGDDAQAWFGDLWPHLTCKGSGIKETPKLDEPCELLIVEDFGTCGLTGDVQSDDVITDKNNFVDFLRSDGRTHKSAGDRGSWGVGKIVFPRSSRINSFLAFTVREDDGISLAMGKVILKNRGLEGVQYIPPGYFVKSWDEDNVPLPEESPEQISKLREAFGMTRTDEPGLSIAVPWVDPSIAFEEILQAVVGKYAYAILAGELAVTLSDGNDTIELNAGSLSSHTDKLDPEETAAINLAAWSLKVQDADRLVVEAPPAAEKQRWKPELLADEIRTQIKDALAERKPVAVRFPLHVPSSKTKAMVPAHFDVYFEYNEGRSLRPRFVRECLAISSVRGLSATARMRSLVVIGPGALADLLGAAEPPSHNDWAANTKNFQDSYKGRTDILTYVKRSVQHLMAAVRAGEEKPDPDVTMDFFAVVEPDEKTPATKKKKTKQNGEKTEKQKVDIDEKYLTRVSITPIKDGFVVRPGDPKAKRYDCIDVVMAYDVENKQPWSQYEPADFDLMRKDRSGIEIVAGGDSDFEIKGPNRVRLTFTGDAYEVYITGFGTDRDLRVKKIPVKTAIDADTEEELAHAEL